MNTKYTTREQYLHAAIDLLKPTFKRAGHVIPPVRVSVGWPSIRPLSPKSRRVGECWDKSAATDKVAQIFISPYLGTAFDAVDTLAHELVHAVLGQEAGHGPIFKKLALAIGLEGKMTQAGAGPEFSKTLHELIKELGVYPHAQLKSAILPGRKKQGTRMIKCECSVCGYTVRTTKKWLDEAIPACPIHKKQMECEIPDEV